MVGWWNSLGHPSSEGSGGRRSISGGDAEQARSEIGARSIVRVMTEAFATCAPQFRRHLERRRREREHVEVARREGSVIPQGGDALEVVALADQTIQDLQRDARAAGRELEAGELLVD